MPIQIGFADRVFRLIALLASIGIIAMMIHVCADVIWRTVSGRPLPATVEIVSRYYMVFVAFLPLAWVEQRRAMISVEIAEGFMTTPVRVFSDIAVALFSCAVYAVMTWTTWEMALKNYATGTFVMALNQQVPVWPSYFLPPFGFGLAAFATALRGVDIIRGAFRGQPATGGTE
ncbi:MULTISPECIES: TRAP transporter small permease [Alphaproteobacteria]|uniref:TRAP transporter small permease protein n=2 Tax=Alphaproteobacteria TaxID=28211 RepID=A0A512HH39_9HYPH|nr:MULTISPECIES: TRAP transporter small permease [Alphaproteobacteria]GEO84764.1 hypothetical protein RNA01_16960 [Ciceribacter naphthalenivorans]GLR20615.1 hypothetical protein GCM10007920_03990 [Ciceribacter naphthalenivorans]GLT03471.1 hypothetical protein GCM10007926_03990 [Sphingomonas psychrolutea]